MNQSLKNTAAGNNRGNRMSSLCTTPQKGWGVCLTVQLDWCKRKRHFRITSTRRWTDGWWVGCWWVGSMLEGHDDNGWCPVGSKTTSLASWPAERRSKSFLMVYYYGYGLLHSTRRSMRDSDGQTRSFKKVESRISSSAGKVKLSLPKKTRQLHPGSQKRQRVSPHSDASK